MGFTSPPPDSSSTFCVSPAHSQAYSSLQRCSSHHLIFPQPAGRARQLLRRACGATTWLGRSRTAILGLFCAAVLPFASEGPAAGPAAAVAVAVFLLLAFFTAFDSFLLTDFDLDTDLCPQVCPLLGLESLSSLAVSDCAYSLSLSCCTCLSYFCLAQFFDSLLLDLFTDFCLLTPFDFCAEQLLRLL